MNKQYYEKNISAEMFNKIISQLKSFPDCTLLSEKLGSDNGHFHTYKFNTKQGKFAVHYDTWAFIFQINAPEEIYQHISDLVNSVRATTKFETEPKQNEKQEVRAKQEDNPKQVKEAKQVKEVKPKQNEKQVKEAKQVKAVKPKQNEKQVKEAKPKQEVKPKQNKKVVRQDLVGSADDAIKGNKKEKVKQEKQEKKEANKQAKQSGKRARLPHDNPSIALEGIEASLEQRIHSTVKSSKSKTTPSPASVTPEKKGKPTEAERAIAAAKKALKKELGNAFEFLSDSSVLQIFNAKRDLDKSNLSNYSGFLLPLFTALEYMIVYLQKREKMGLKALGLAFERDGDNYVLKPMYAKKIDSVIYIEVITALYNEYFKRHKYVHASARHGATDIVSDKQLARNIFADIVYILNYNCKKLLEIGYAE